MLKTLGKMAMLVGLAVAMQIVLMTPGQAGEPMASYPVFAPSSSSATPTAIVEKLSKKDASALSLGELLDLAVAQALLRHHDEALSLLDKRLADNPPKPVQADILACKAVLCALKGRDGQQDEERKEAYRQGMEAAKKAYSLSPKNKVLTLHFQALAICAGDEAGKKESAELVAQLYPEAASEEFTDPVQGTVMVAEITVAALVYLYAPGSPKPRTAVLAKLPVVLETIGPVGAGLMEPGN